MPTATKQQPAETERPRWRVRIRIPYVILLILLGLFAYKFEQRVHEVRGLARQEAALRLANQQTRQQNAAITRAIAQYRTDGYIEAAARSIFGYIKPGDTPIQVHGVTPPVLSVHAAPARPLQPPEPTWKLWWRSFFG